MAIHEALKRAIQERLTALAREHRVPGAALAVLHEGDVWDCATGYLNLNTMVEATPESLFQIGSITKVYTTTLIMQLVDAGRVDLDAPIQSYLPAVHFADEGASARVTVRHLLNHTSGVDGDYFGDFGYGDDAIERYVAACTSLPQLFGPGDMFSYCNAGFTVLGRLLEVVYGTTYHQVLKDKLVRPLATSSPKTLLQEIVMHRVAVGHDTDAAGGDPTVVTTWSLPHAGTPKGSTTCGTASDVVAFARLHLDGGRDVVSRSSVEAMRRREVELVSTRPGDEAWGLGWALDTWEGSEVFGHDGGTLGQRAYLRVVPGAGFAAALLTNAYTSGPLYEQLFGLLVGELCNISIPESPQPPAASVPVDTEPYAGSFERLGVRTDIEQRDGTLWMEQSFSGEMSAIEHKQPPSPLIAAGEDVFFAFSQDTNDHYPLHFLKDRTGCYEYLFDGRIARRTR
jgi:CubicO group peptidase (beta-lactamase class C family)